MSLSEDFKKASQDVQKLASKPDTSVLLELYALFKQSQDGDVAGARPGLLDMKGRAKYDAWAKKKGLAKDAAMQAYVALVAKLRAS